MNKKIPGLLDVKDFTGVELERWGEAMDFRGAIIESSLHIENNLEVCITTFFCREVEGNKAIENIFNLLHFHIYPNCFDFMKKYTTVQQVVKMVLPNAYKYDDYFSLLNKLIRVRNYVAHNNSGHEFKGGISFIKHSSSFDNGSKKWSTKFKNIEINKKASAEIIVQLSMIKEYMLYIADSLEEDINKREYNLPSTRFKRFNAKYEGLLKEGGVNSIKLPSQ